MKIQKFNENVLQYKGWKPTDKVLKVEANCEFEVLIDNIRKTDKFLQYGELKNDWKEEKLFYGLEEWLYESGNIDFKYTLYDGNGNIIDDEQEFDKYVKNIKNYNI